MSEPTGKGRFWHHASLRRFVIAMVALVLTAISTGWQWQRLQAEQQMAEALDGLIVLTTVRTNTFHQVRNDVIRMIAHTDDALLPRRLVLYWPQTLWHHLGADAQCWHVAIRISPFVALGNPAGFDAAHYWRARSIVAKASVVSHPGVRPCLQRSAPGILAVRKDIQRRINTALPPTDGRAVLSALIIGDRSALAADTRELFARVGIVHLIAISGLHVGMVSGAVFLLVRWLLQGRWAHADNVAVLGACASALMYALIAGSGVPAMRAATAVVLVSVLYWRHMSLTLLQLVCFVSWLFLIAMPVAAVGASFVLSFAAVWVLALAQWARAAQPPRPATGWHDAIGVQCVLSLAGAPLVAAWFGYVPLLSVPVNILVLPLFSFVVVPLGFIGVVLSWIGVPGSTTLWRGSAALIDALVSGLSRWAGDGVIWHTAEMSWLVWLAIAVMISTGVLLRAPMARFCLVPGVVALLFAGGTRTPPGCVDVQMLSVGHGTAIRLDSATHHFLYDTGPAYRGGGSAAQVVIVPVLRAAGVRRLDRVIVSHDDMDHAGGVHDLQAEIAVNDWLGGPGLACRAGLRWRHDGVRFETLWPESDMPGDIGNNASCVISVRAGARRLVLFGDLEASAEAALIATTPLLAMATTAPHHGSRTSSSQALVDATTPRWVMASAGRRRGWTIPHPDVIARWQQAGAKVSVSATDGAISLRLCKDSQVPPARW